MNEREFWLWCCRRLNDAARRFESSGERCRRMAMRCADRAAAAELRRREQ